MRCINSILYPGIEFFYYPEYSGDASPTVSLQ